MPFPATFKYHFDLPIKMKKIENAMARIGFAFYRLFSSFTYIFFFFKH